MKTLVLFSGGIDSTTALVTDLRSAPQDLTAFYVRYNYEYARYEERAVKRITKYYKVPLKIVRTDLQIAHDSWFDLRLGRNTFLLSTALTYAATNGFDRIVTGFIGGGLPLYTDTSEKFVRSFNSLIKAQGLPVLVEAPFVNKVKEDVVREGLNLGIPYKYTFSCIHPIHGKPCGFCVACTSKAAAFAANGVYNV